MNEKETKINIGNQLFVSHMNETFVFGNALLIESYINWFLGHF